MHKNIQNTDSLDRWRVGKIRFFRGFDLKKGKSRIYLAYRLQNGRIAQLVRAPRWHRGGHRFESYYAHHSYLFGRLAQLVRASRLHRECREFESLIAHHSDFYTQPYRHKDKIPVLRKNPALRSQSKPVQLPNPDWLHESSWNRAHNPELAQNLSSVTSALRDQRNFLPPEHREFHSWYSRQNSQCCLRRNINSW